MKQLLFLCFYIFFAPISIGQEHQEAPPLTNTNLNARLSQYRIDYPIGVNGETFFNGAAEYQISRKLSAQLESFYAKFGTHEQINSNISFKWYVQETLYLFAGTETQYDRNQVTGELELLRVNLNLGVGYEVNPDVLLELGYHPQISNPKTDSFGRPLSKQNSFSLRTRF